MKYYLLEAKRTNPHEEIQKSVYEDQQRYFDKGGVLFTSPLFTDPPSQTGVTIVRVESREALDKLLAEEPFIQHKVLEYTRLTEINPPHCHESVKSWFGL